MAAAVIAATLLDGVRPDLAARLAVPSELAQWLASIATALAGALAAAPCRAAAVSRCPFHYHCVFPSLTKATL